ncbi:galactokinase [Litoribacter alkaliphilus]|uniref:Galactokinase n=1 Tax=Litoribacter ruber TaxID=702568 RepID=A0AAP2CNF3_9BACT|nr:galactokinase [Litoribacter alkaliphilus]MBS9525735.1 galactokinase [Litoribacter alkaliphilus]
MAKSGNTSPSLSTYGKNDRQILSTYQTYFGSEPILVKAPGRINLIGDHTDYNEGFVLPAAIDMEIELAVGENHGDLCRLYSLDYEQEVIFNLKDFKPLPSGWANYIMGVVAQFQANELEVRGFNCVFGGNIPIGAGLSSSAALECATALALSQLFGCQIEKVDLIKIAQKAEHTFAGVQCGIMDQFASIMGKAGNAIRLDCRSLEFKHFPLDLQDYEILLCDTQVKHSLADSAYNTRREECDSGIKTISQHYPEVHSLRDVSLAMLEKHKTTLDPLIYQRCKFVIEENQRVLEAGRALEAKDLAAFGALMYKSHTGLSKSYEVSCAELDMLVDATRDLEEVLGSRMMGGGFGGCTINLVEKSQAQVFEEKMKLEFKQAFGRDLTIYRVGIQDGARIL